MFKRFSISIFHLAPSMNTTEMKQPEERVLPNIKLTELDSRVEGPFFVRGLLCHLDFTVDDMT